MKINSRTLARLAKNPHQMQRFMATGVVPDVFSEPSPSPLFTLLKSIHPRELLSIQGVLVGPLLGYAYRIEFRNAAQAYNWVGPSCGAGSPAQAARNVSFRKVLTIDDLADSCASLPRSVVDAWWARHSHLRHLRRKLPL
jgi:hypothetical protein